MNTEALKKLNNLNNNLYERAPNGSPIDTCGEMFATIDNALAEFDELVKTMIEQAERIGFIEVDEEEEDDNNPVSGGDCVEMVANWLVTLRAINDEND